MKVFKVIFLLALCSCATSQKNKSFTYIEKPHDKCLMVATLGAEGFSLIPGVANLMAKSILEDKANEFNVNSIHITREEGLFLKKISAIGYRCKVSVN